jgi:hypothetical protein
MERRQFKTKDTRATIIEYAKELEEKIIAREEGKFNPAVVKEVERKKEVKEKSEKILKREILSQEILDEHKALEEKIEDMKNEIKIIADIDINVNTLAALIEANNIEVAQAQAAKEEIIAEKTAELAALEEEIKTKKAEWEEEDKQYKADLQVKRDREAADHKYILDRDRKKENDEWEDTKNAREKAIDLRELAVLEREVNCNAIEETNEALQNELALTASKIAEIEKTAKEDAEKAANKTLAIREAAMKKEVEFDKKMVDAELINTKGALAKAEAALAAKDAELKEAYAKMNELATKSVQAGQPVYVNKDNK